MSFLMGHNTSTSSGQKEDFYNNLLKYLGNGGFNNLFPQTSVDKAALQPYMDLFTQQNTRNFAQAKESAGNLTGSGFANTLGARASEADSQQGAFLANLLESRRTNDANRMASLLLGVTQGAGEKAYQPGFLDYALQGLGAAAPLIAAGGSATSNGGAGGTPHNPPGRTY